MSAAGNYLQRLSEEAGSAWNRFWFAPASSLPLARLRIAVGVIAALYFLAWSTHVSRMLSADGLLPPQTVQEVLQLRAEGRTHYHFSPLFQLDSPTALLAYNVAAIAAALLLACGLFARLNCLVTLVFLLTFIHRAPLLAGPLETVLVMLLLYLLVGPSGEWLSLDARRKRKSAEPPPAPSWAARLSLRLIQVHIAGLIWLVACSMLSSRFWWDGTAIWALEAQSLSRPVDLSWLRNMPKVVNGWTHLFVLINLAFPILAWNRLLRPLVVTLAIAAWLLMIPLTGQVLYVAAVVTAMCTFLATDEPRATVSRT